MAVQQRKVSKRKTRCRKGANHYEGLQPGVCPNCDSPRIPHRVCGKCGFYNGRQVISVAAE
ncbi:MAG: 50S ribosomal protein L32 [Verrucomicrobiota bacterium]